MKTEKENINAKKSSDRLSWHILLMRVVRIKLEMNPFAFNLNMYVLTYMGPLGLLERDLGARSLGFSPDFDVLP